MALSGSFTGTTNNEFVEPKITWSATQSITGNYSDVTATLTYRRTNTGYTTSGTWSGTVNIGGNSTSGSKAITVTYNSNTVALTANARVYHDADGSKTITISATGRINNTTVTSTTCSRSITLDTIARATTPVLSASQVGFGSDVTITLNRASSAFTHDLTYSFATLKNQTSGLSRSTGVGTSATFTPPETLMNRIPNAVSGTCTITCKTYNGSTLIGTKTATITLKVPLEVKPDFTSTITDATSGITAKFNAFVQNKSKLRVAVNAEGAYGSTIVSCETTIESVLYTGTTVTSNTITTSGTVPVKTVVKDSRGRSKTATTNVTVLPYEPPKIESLTAWRINTGGTADEDGTRIGLHAKFSISPVNNLNDRTFNFRYKRVSASSYTSFDSGTAAYTYDSDRTYPSTPSISTDYAYNIQLVISDFFGSVSYETTISTAQVIMDFRSTGKGMAIGKVSESDAFEVGMESHFKNLVHFDSVPTVHEITGYVTGGNPRAIFEGGYYQFGKLVIVQTVATISTGGFVAGTNYRITQDALPRPINPVAFAVAVNGNSITAMPMDIYLNALGQMYLESTAAVPRDIAIEITGIYISQ